MKLIALKIIKAKTCNGLLNGLYVPFRDSSSDSTIFDPLCLIGPNGTGKSQLLQIIAEIFQVVFKQVVPDEERGVENQDLEFEIEYLIAIGNESSQKHVRITRQKTDKQKPRLIFWLKTGDEWIVLDCEKDDISTLLPTKVVGYTSGDNETLSLPFLISRSGYSHEVSHNATKPELRGIKVPDTRMLLIDYGTNLEVLVANLLLNPEEVRSGLLAEPNLKKIRSFRCVIQLKPSGPPSGGVKLTDELKQYIENLKRCATTCNYEKNKETWTLDYLVSEDTYKAFAAYWSSAIDLYSSFHKLSMLNDLVIPKTARNTFTKNIEDRRFASRLPEPFEVNKIFRFERVEFISAKDDQIVDYVSLSDGEHQLAQVLGTVCMASGPNVLFLLDEPESHFNPKWRIEFVSKLLNLNTFNGKRGDKSVVAKQECLITTHSPFVPSDMKSENVLIFSKNDNTSEIEVRRPRIETYGSTFDAILDECFDIRPPMSCLPRNEIEKLMLSNDAKEIRSGMQKLGDSVDKLYLADRIRSIDLIGKN